MTEDLEKLYGAGYELTKFKELSQPGQFVCKETVDVCGPNGTIEEGENSWPIRKATQVEILASDCFKTWCRSTGWSFLENVLELRNYPCWSKWFPLK